jgi:hypothetical protein
MGWNKMEIPIVSGVDCIRNPTINDGQGNFIQIYFNNIPYFRAGERNHYELLEDFLKEVSINDFEKEKKEGIGFYDTFIPVKKGSLYELVGAGTIEEATIIKENINELSGRGHIAIRGYSEKYNLYPNIKHISKILKHFEDPLIFVGSEYWTEEERGFVENYGQEEDMGGEDEEPLDGNNSQF